MKQPEPAASTLLVSPVPLLTRAAGGSHLDRDVRQGLLVRVKHGVYAPRSAWQELLPSERYRAEIHAVALLRPDAVFCLESAAALMDLPLLTVPQEVHLLSTDRSASRAVDRIRTHVSGAERSVVRRDAMLVTSPEETVVDLARHRHPAESLAAVEALLRTRGWEDGEALRAINDERLGARGRQHARWPLGFASPGAETVLESVSRAVVHWLGYPAPILQQEFIVDGCRYRTDMWWQAQKIIGEADGRAKYGRTPDAQKNAVWQEKRREDALRRVSRGFVRWSWDDAADHRALDRILSSVGLPRIRSVQHLPLMTLELLLAHR